MEISKAHINTTDVFCVLTELSNWNFSDFYWLYKFPNWNRSIGSSFSYNIPLHFFLRLNSWIKKTHCFRDLYKWRKRRVGATPDANLDALPHPPKSSNSTRKSLLKAALKWECNSKGIRERSKVQQQSERQSIFSQPNNSLHHNYCIGCTWWEGWVQPKWKTLVLWRAA